MLQRKIWFWDRLGVWTSGLCVVHCLALPVVFAVLPSLMPDEAVSDSAHRAFGAALVVISLFAFVPGYRLHRIAVAMALGAFGLTCVLLAAFAGHERLGDYGETGLTVIGSIALIVAHLRNRLLCRCCATENAVQSSFRAV